MDIGRLKNNKEYLEEDICDTEIILSLKESPEFNLHIWDAYFSDIFRHPLLVEKRGTALRGIITKLKERTQMRMTTA